MTGKEYSSSDVEIFSESIVFDYVVPGYIYITVYETEMLDWPVHWNLMKKN